MDFKKATLFAIPTYLVPFLITLAASVAAGAAPQNSPAVGLVAIALTIIVLVAFSLRYFRSVKPSAKEGLFFGIVVGIVGIVIDTAITTVTDAAKPAGNLENPLFWTSILFILIITSLIGFLKGRKSGAK